MNVRVPDSPGLTSLNSLPDTRADSFARPGSIGGVAQGHHAHGASGFDGEAVLAADVWGGHASRSLLQASPSAYASGPDPVANIERDVDYILSPMF